MPILDRLRSAAGKIEAAAATDSWNREAAAAAAAAKTRSEGEQMYARKH